MMAKKTTLFPLRVRCQRLAQALQFFVSAFSIWNKKNSNDEQAWTQAVPPFLTRKHRIRRAEACADRIRVFEQHSADEAELQASSDKFVDSQTVALFASTKPARKFSLASFAGTLAEFRHDPAPEREEFRWQQMDPLVCCTLREPKYSEIPKNWNHIYLLHWYNEWLNANTVNKWFASSSSRIACPGANNICTKQYFRSFRSCCCRIETKHLIWFTV